MNSERKTWYYTRAEGKYPKEYIQDSKHGESLKSRVEFGNETNDRHNGKGKGKVHPYTGTEALYRPYGP